MARNNHVHWVLQLLTLLAVCFFGVLIINTLDRNRRAVAELKEAIESMPVGGGVMLTGNSAGNSALTPCKLADFFDPQAKHGGTFTKAIASDTGTLNPILSSDAIASDIVGMCVSPLAGRDPQQPEEFVPLVANSWQVSADGKRITVQLRQGVLWQDFVDPESGKRVPEKVVTAHDFVFYLDVLRNPQVNAAHLRNYYQDLESYRAISDFELELVWKNEYFRSLEMTLGLIPLPRHFYCPDGAEFDPEKFNYDHKRSKMVVGCGPYKLTGYISDRRYEFTRFKSYFGNALGIAPPIRKCVFEVVSNENTRFQMLLSGELDMLGITPEQWVKRSQKKPFSAHVLTVGESSEDFPLQNGEKLRKIKYLANVYFYIGYNMRNDLFRDKRVRQAMTMLCNRQKILDDVYYGQGRITSGPIFCDSAYYDKTIQPWPFDPVRAKALLAEAGWRDSDDDGILDKDGKKFVFTALQVAGNKNQELILSIFKEDLARAGIDMKIVAMDWALYLKKLESRDYDVCSLGWSMPYESDPYQVWHSSQTGGSGSNHVGFENPEVDRLITDIRRTFDVEKRKQLFYQFHALIHDEQPYTFLVVPDSLTVVSGRMHNVRCFPLGLDHSMFWVEP